MSEADVVLEARGLAKRYRRGVRALAGVDLAIPFRPPGAADAVPKPDDTVDSWSEVPSIIERWRLPPSS